MKRRIAFILMLVMLASCMFGLSAVAEADLGGGTSTQTVTYKPKVTYANVIYSNKLSVQFAVPAPAENALSEGTSVQLLLWVQPEVNLTLSFETAEETLSAADATVDIEGVAHLVYSYDIDAHRMTDVIYARPYIKDAVTGAVTYGDVLDYSVVEYVKTAKGEFSGFAGIESEETKALLDALLVFGGTLQQFVGDEGHTPNNYLASDTLGKIWITPVINGVAGEKVFGGFFKAGEGEYATVKSPYFDILKIAGADAYLDAEGNPLVDADEDENTGFQIPTADGDIEITVKYERLSVFNADVSVNTENSSANSNVDPANNVQFYDLGIGGFCFMTSYGYESKPNDYVYNSLDVIDDPYNPGEKTYRWVCSHTTSLRFGNSADDYKRTKIYDVEGFGDTIYPVITLEFMLARGENGKVINTADFRIRGTGTSDLFIPFKVASNGDFHLYTSNSTTEVVATIPETGYGTFGVVIDLRAEKVIVYASDENGDMVKVGETSQVKYAGTNVTTMGWETWMRDNQARVEWNGGTNNSLSDEQKAMLADLDGDGVGETAMKNTDGTYNPEALAAIRSSQSAMLIKDFDIMVGNLYE